MMFMVVKRGWKDGKEVEVNKKEEWYTIRLVNEVNGFVSDQKGNEKRGWDDWST